MNKFVVYYTVQGTAKILRYFSTKAEAEAYAAETERKIYDETMENNPDWIAIGGDMPEFCVAEITPAVENLISMLCAELKWTRDRRNELHKRVYGISLD